MPHFRMVLRSAAVAVVWASLLCSCDQNSQAERKDNSDGRPSAGHPAVPGRTTPCPREGGLDKAGYPCEPPLGTSSGSK